MFTFGVMYAVELENALVNAERGMFTASYTVMVYPRIV